MSTTPTNIWNSGFFASLFSNAANGVDALGRNTASNITAISNAAAVNKYANQGILPSIKISTNEAYAAIAAVVVAIIIGIAIIFR